MSDHTSAMGISGAPSVKRTVVSCHDDEMAMRTPCCQQEVCVGGSCFEIGAEILCVGCAGQYHVEFVGIKGVDVHALWSLR